MSLLEKVMESQIRTDLPEFRVGDTVRVDVNIVEGKEKESRLSKELLLKSKVEALVKRLPLERFHKELVWKEFSLLTHQKSKVLLLLEKVKLEEVNYII